MDCSVDGCGREGQLRGYCQKHYTWARRHGLLERLTPRPERFSLVERFRRSYEIDANGCWLWKRTLDARGYGVIVDECHRNAKAHRYSYKLRFDFLPDHLHVCHDCDVPSCVNPDHLFLGTDLENRLDSVIKGRHSFGNRNGKRKLSEADVVAIRRVHAEGGVSQGELARQYGVKPSTISLVLSRKNWKRAG